MPPRDAGRRGEADIPGGVAGRGAALSAPGMPSNAAIAFDARRDADAESIRRRLGPGTLRGASVAADAAAVAAAIAGPCGRPPRRHGGAADLERGLGNKWFAGASRAIIDATSTGNREAYRAAAAALDDAAAAGGLPRGEEFYATACSAPCYDIAGMRGDAVRMYRLLGPRCAGELDYIVRSPAHAARLVEGLASLGAGDGVRSLSSAVGGASRWILARAAPGRPVEHDAPDDCNLFMATVRLLSELHESLGGPGSDGVAGGLAGKAGRHYGELVHFCPGPPPGFMASLYLRLIEATYERSAAGLGIGGGAGKARQDDGERPGEDLRRTLDAVMAGKIKMNRYPSAKEYLEHLDAASDE